MKFAVGIVVFIWLLCGAIGAGLQGHLNAEHWKMIARGPITLANALSEHPVTLPGQN